MPAKKKLVEPKLNFDAISAATVAEKKRPGIPCYICTYVHRDDRDTIDRLLASKLRLLDLVKQIRAAGIGEMTVSRLRNHRDNFHRDRYAQT